MYGPLVKETYLCEKYYDKNSAGRTRTCDFRVMSPASFQLLYLAIFPDDRCMQDVFVIFMEVSIRKPVDLLGFAPRTDRL